MPDLWKQMLVVLRSYPFFSELGPWTAKNVSGTQAFWYVLLREDYFLSKVLHTFWPNEIESSYDWKHFSRLCFPQKLIHGTMKFMSLYFPFSNVYLCFVQNRLYEILYTALSEQFWLIRVTTKSFYRPFRLLL